MMELRTFRWVLWIAVMAIAILMCVASVVVLTWAPAQQFVYQHYLAMLWTGLALGMIPSILYLAQHRPTTWLDPTALNASGWVPVIFLGYLQKAVAVLIQRNNIIWRGPGNALNQLGFLLAMDALLMFRVISFLQYRRAFNKEKAKLAEAELQAVDDTDDEGKII